MKDFQRNERRTINLCNGITIGRDQLTKQKKVNKNKQTVLNLGRNKCDKVKKLYEKVSIIILV